ncbi:MAG: electron transfer flavoprotein alpha/ beta subunit [Euryarchaeota archaeon]|nr:electron transfer flavoprotein alpha/ beta subunit [Euryarchaeota archaeon]
MRIAVCIKQVPVANAMVFDAESRTLKREGVPLEVNSFDLRAVAKAVEMKRSHGGEVVVVTMGPPQARSALEHCLAMGADRALHLCDRAFAGSDTLATAQALALALRREKFYLVFCGKHSTDAETSQVGPELAELLDIPQVTAVQGFTVFGRTLAARRETETGYEIVETTLPALLTASEDLAPERFPTREDREQAKSRPIQTLTATELSPDSFLFGKAGSPTEVAGLQAVPVNREGRTLPPESAEQFIRETVETIRERRIPPAPEASAPPPRAPGRAVWVVAEHREGKLRPVSLELLGKAADLADKAGGEVAALLLGHRLEKHVPALAAHGADHILTADHPDLEPYTTEAHAAVLAEAIRTRRPRSVLLPSTLQGRDLAPRVAARLGLGLTGDCVDLDINGEGRLVQHKPAFGGNVVAPILSRTSPEMATVRPGMLRARPPDSRRTAPAEPLPVHLPPARVRVALQSRQAGGDIADLESAPIVVGVGMGIGGPENLAPIRRLAELLQAPLAATRDITDAGWLPRHHQVGLTGRAIAPRLYIAIGIRGAMEHMVGVRRAGTIIAINKDPRAPIFPNSDLGIAGDWEQVVPRLTRELAQMKEAAQAMAR